MKKLNLKSIAILVIMLSVNYLSAQWNPAWYPGGFVGPYASVPQHTTSNSFKIATCHMGTFCLKTIIAANQPKTGRHKENEI